MRRFRLARRARTIALSRRRSSRRSARSGTASAHSVSQIDIQAAREGAERSLIAPTGLSTGPDGTICVADSGNHCIRTISPERVVGTLAGSIFDFADGRGADGRFRQPLALDVGADGNCYVTDTGNNAIRRVAPDGAVSTVAGSPPGGDADGVGMDVGMRWPTGIVIGHSGELWAADYGNRSVRWIERNGAAATVVRFDGRRWPVSPALATGGELIVATEVIDQETRSLSCLASIEAAR